MKTEDGYNMIKAYLIANGYDGLSNDDVDCACTTDDLMPCGGDFAMSCTAGHKVDGCDEMCGEGCDFHIVPGKRQVTATAARSTDMLADDWTDVGS